MPDAITSATRLGTAIALTLPDTANEVGGMGPFDDGRMGSEAAGTPVKT